MSNNQQHAFRAQYILRSVGMAFVLFAIGAFALTSCNVGSTNVCLSNYSGKKPAPPPAQGCATTCTNGRNGCTNCCGNTTKAKTPARTNCMDDCPPEPCAAATYAEEGLALLTPGQGTQEQVTNQLEPCLYDDLAIEDYTSGPGQETTSGPGQEIEKELFVDSAFNQELPFESLGARLIRIGSAQDVYDFVSGMTTTGGDSLNFESYPESEFLAYFSSLTEQNRDEELARFQGMNQDCIDSYVPFGQFYLDNFEPQVEEWLAAGQQDPENQTDRFTLYQFWLFNGTIPCA